MDYRVGYWAGKDFKQFNTSDKERQLDEAMLMGDPVTDIDIALDAYYFRLARDRYFVPVVAKIPGSELELAKKGGVESTTFDFIGVVRIPPARPCRTCAITFPSNSRKNSPVNSLSAR